ncbi:MAG: VOC family protein [Caldilineaceae bacterium]|nr:VOC family protein [Caldilineaceae bacterium]
MAGYRAGIVDCGIKEWTQEGSKVMAFLRHVALRTKDLERSRAFYEKILGLKFLCYIYDEGYPPGCYLSDGSVNMTLIQYEGEERPPIAHEGEYIHLGFIVDNLEEAYHLLREEGAEILVEDVKVEREFNYDHVPEGSLKTTDPDGNILDISERKDEWDGVRL